MTLSVVGATSGVGSDTPVAHASTASGDLLLLFVSTRNSGGSVNIVPPAGWTQGGTVLGAGSSADDYTLFRWYYQEAASGGAVDLGTWTGGPGGTTFSGAGLSWICVTVRGHRALASGLTFPSTTSASDNTDTNEAARSVDAGSVTPNTNNALAVLAFATRVTTLIATEFTPPAGYTAAADVWDTSSLSHAVAYKALATTAATGAQTGTLDGTSGLSEDYKTEASFSIIVRPANQAPSTPGAFTAPTSGSSFSGSHTVAHPAATDDDFDTLTYRIEASIDNGASWPYLLDAARSATSGTLDFSSIPASTSAKLRVRASDGSATSAWRESDTFTIAHNTAPTPATPLSPTGGATADRTNVVVRWLFNDPDPGDTQSKADVRYRLASGGAWTTVLAAVTTASSYSIPSTLAADDWEWQVLTYDAAGTAATSWSTSGLFTASDVPNPPTITSHADDDVIAASTDSLAWSGTGDTTRARRVADDGSGSPDTGTVYEDSGAVTPGALDQPFEFPVNDRTEHLQVMRTVSGLDSDWASVRVLVDYTPPAAATLTITEHLVDELVAALRVVIDNPDPAGGEPNPTTNDLYRRIKRVDATTLEATYYKFDGTVDLDGERIAADLDVDGFFLDWSVPSFSAAAIARGEGVEYRVRTFGDNGTFVDGDWDTDEAGTTIFYGGSYS